VDVKCKYDYTEHKYDFTIIGVAPGEAELTLYYYTADDQKVPVTLSISVDDKLNVTQIG